MQRAVLALTLHEFPRQITRDALTWKGLGKGEPLNKAVASLSNVGLLWCEGEFVVPTLPARHFHWLEWS
jgi:hypothetical protein